MQIHLQQLGKRFKREWIFRNLDLELHAGQSCVIIGPNGSGKSTLLQVLSGAMPRSEGKILYAFPQQAIAEESWFKYMVIAAPYLELIEEFTLAELLDFHVQFKPFKAGISHTFLLEQLELQAAKDKYVKYFSSGMKQRLKLALAFYSDVPLVLLDEPTSNLDARWSDWYKTEVQKLTATQIVVICSNIPSEYDFCDKQINIADYK
ncbi:MAG: ABC transporter ATP-binding protein [Spirosomaceae bacterium]|jgi:ABC-2 type transport system ATP-binding protein|nr:ABC transporter ATP-binding protein [Spirosomataceae bacterium]